VVGGVFVINRKVRAADAKEVGMGNPAEKTYCCPNRATNIDETVNGVKWVVFLGTRAF
jgi:hypothetical protein